MADGRNPKAKQEKVGIEVVADFNTIARYVDGELVEPVYYKARCYPNPDVNLQRLANSGSDWVIDHRTEAQRKASIRRHGPHHMWGYGH